MPKCTTYFIYSHFYISYVRSAFTIPDCYIQFTLPCYLYSVLLSGNLLKWPLGKVTLSKNDPPRKMPPPPPQVINDQPIDTTNLFTSGSYFNRQNWIYFVALFSLSPPPYQFLHLPHRLAFIGQTNKKLVWNVETHRTEKRNFSAPCPITCVLCPSIHFMLTFTCQKNYAKQ